MKKVIFLIFMVFFLVSYTCRLTLITQKYVLENGKVYFNTYMENSTKWMAEENILEDVDIDSFKILDSNEVAFDKDNIYVLGKTKKQSKKKYDIYNGDKNSLEKVWSNRKQTYYKDKNYVYYNYMIVPGADPWGFRLLENDYLADKRYVYYKGERLKNSDSKKTFESLDRVVINESCVYKYELYAENNGNKYYFDKIYKGNEYDVKTFIYLDEDYSKDKNYVYYRGKKLDKIDSKTFELYDSEYFADKNGVYYMKQKIPDSDINTFIILDDGYSKDKKHVYYENKIIPGADSETFRKAEKQGYYIDNNNNVYTKEGILVKNSNIEDYK